jgi:hypothetical protein
MTFGKKNPIFNDLHRKRNELYMMYLRSISTFNENDHIKQLEDVVNDLLHTTYVFTKIEDVNSAISALTKFRRKHINTLSVFEMHIKDIKREHNYAVAALNGLRCLELVKGLLDPVYINEVIQYETDESNPDGRSLRALRVAEVELTKNLHENMDNKFKCDAICKVSKSVISKLHRHRSAKQRA